MSETTIRVATEVRSRLRHVAQRRHITMGALLDEVSRKLDREERMAEAQEAYEQMLRDDPEGFAADRNESVEWQDAEIGARLGDAAEEYPEYNR